VRVCVRACVVFCFFLLLSLLWTSYRATRSYSKEEYDSISITFFIYNLLVCVVESVIIYIIYIDLIQNLILKHIKLTKTFQYM
jgi:TRAP-type C4-dicarboxylate transport system permease small subunit